MLVLTRKIEQAVVVGDAADVGRLLKITVLEIARGSVRLGFEVDASVPVHRWEVWQRIRDEDPTEGSPETLASLVVQ